MIIGFAFLSLLERIESSPTLYPNAFRTFWFSKKWPLKGIHESIFCLSFIVQRVLASFLRMSFLWKDYSRNIYHNCFYHCWKINRRPIFIKPLTPQINASQLWCLEKLKNHQVGWGVIVIYAVQKCLLSKIYVPRVRTNTQVGNKSRVK